MNKQEILEKLSNHIEQMIVQFETICSHSDRIPKIEMDRMLSEIRATYELFTVLNYVNTYAGESKNPLLEKIQQTKQMMASVAAKTELPAEEIFSSTSVQEEMKEEEETISFEAPVIPEEEKVEAPITTVPEPEIELPVETISIPAPTTEPVEETKDEKIEEEKLLEIEEKNEQEIIAATVSQTEIPATKKLNTEGAPQGLHNKSLEEEDGYIADKIGVKIADLKKNVALHEKFLYINELFGGNNNAYNEMIDALEASANAAEASKVLGHYGQKFNWNPEGKTFKQLRLLIQRRF